MYNLVAVDPKTRVEVTVSKDIETFVLSNVLYFVSTNGSTNDTQDQVKMFTKVGSGTGKLMLAVWCSLLYSVGNNCTYFCK